MTPAAHDSHKEKLLVIGSINMDIVNRVKHHPAPGETVKGEGTQYHHGGKGANQAVAAARAGGRVVMAGAVGTDAFGDALLASLAREGVETDIVARKDGTSGMAFITVSESGQNCIVLSEGANGLLAPDDIRAALARERIKLVLLQNEIPWETNESAIRKAKENGMRVWFNPAPALRIPESVLPLIDTLVLNESEAEHLTGRRVLGEADAERAAKDLLAGGTGEVIVTLGAQGSLYMNAGGSALFTPSFPVTAVDTTAAGDTFIGYCAAAVCAGMPMEKALKFASAASAISVTRAGAQPSIPHRAEVERFLAERERRNGRETNCGEVER